MAEVIGCTKEGHNKKGSPKRLGKPDLCESRNPTSGECEWCDLRRSDVIVRDASGQIYIMRCVEKGVSEPKVCLPEKDCRRISRDLEEFWSR